MFEYRPSYTRAMDVPSAMPGPPLATSRRAGVLRDVREARRWSQATHQPPTSAIADGTSIARVYVDRSVLNVTASARAFKRRAACACALTAYAPTAPCGHGALADTTARAITNMQ